MLKFTVATRKEGLMLGFSNNVYFVRFCVKQTRYMYTGCCISLKFKWIKRNLMQRGRLKRFSETGEWEKKSNTRCGECGNHKESIQLVWICACINMSLLILCERVRKCMTNIKRFYVKYVLLQIKLPSWNCNSHLKTNINEW